MDRKYPFLHLAIVDTDTGFVRVLAEAPGGHGRDVQRLRGPAPADALLPYGQTCSSST